MCTLAAAGLATTVIGGIIQFQGQRAAGKAARAEAEYKAALAQNNRIRAEYLAEDAIERGKEEEAEERLRGRMLVGLMRAELASSGQVVDEGSAGELTIDQAELNELNAITVRTNAAREAQEFRIRASQFGSEADLQEFAGRQAERRSRRSGLGTLLTTATSVAGRWYQFRQQGAF